MKHVCARFFFLAAVSLCIGSAMVAAIASAGTAEIDEKTDVIGQ